MRIVELRGVIANGRIQMQLRLPTLLTIQALLVFLLAGCGGGSSRICAGCGNGFLLADADAPGQVASGAEVILDASDSEGDIDDYNWIQLLGPPVAIRNPAFRRASFIAPEVDVSTTLAFRLIITNDFGGSDSDRVGIIVVPRLQQAAAIGSKLVLDQLKPQKLLNAPTPSATLSLPVSAENQMVYQGLWLSVLAAQPVWNATSLESGLEPSDTTLRLDEVRALTSHLELESGAALSELSAGYLSEGMTAMAVAVAGDSPSLAAQLQGLLANDRVLSSALANPIAITSASDQIRLLSQTANGQQLHAQTLTATEAEAQAVQLILGAQNQPVVDPIEVAAATLVVLRLLTQAP